MCVRSTVSESCCSRVRSKRCRYRRGRPWHANGMSVATTFIPVDTDPVLSVPTHIIPVDTDTLSPTVGTDTVTVAMWTTWPRRFHSLFYAFKKQVEVSLASVIRLSIIIITANEFKKYVTCLQYDISTSQPQPSNKYEGCLLQINKHASGPVIARRPWVSYHTLVVRGFSTIEVAVASAC